MPLYLWGRKLRPGAYLGRPDLFGDLEESWHAGHLYYQTGGPFVMDVQGRFWKVEHVGVGAGYFWSDNFSGWTMGAEISFSF